MLALNKNDFDLLPTKLSIARVYWQQVQALAKIEHDITHEDLYYQLEQRYQELFSQELPFKSFDSFRKWRDANRKEIG